MGAIADEVDGCVFGTRILGLKELPDDVANGSRWNQLAEVDLGVLEELFKGVHKFELGDYVAIISAPLSMFDTLERDPDVIMVYGNPARGASTKC